jgi:hypothetical protein
MVTKEDRVGERRKGGKADLEEKTYRSTKDATFGNFAANTTAIWHADKAF